MPTPAPTTFLALMQGIESYLQSQELTTDTTSIYYSLNPVPPITPNAQTIYVICPGKTTVEQPTVTGAGNYFTAMISEISIWQYTNLGTDERNRDDNWLQDTTNGSLVALNNLIQAAQFASFTSGTNLLNDVPFKLVSVEAPSRELPKQDRMPGWGKIETKWRCKWWMSLPTTS
jgi:hypothetical protein